MERFKFYFQNSCNDVAVNTFSSDSNGGKQRFTVSGYTVSDYFDVGDELEFIYDGKVWLDTIIDIAGNAITMRFDYNALLDSSTTFLQFPAKTECFPDDFYKGKFEHKLQENEFFYRLTYKGEVTFTGEDYQYLLANIIEESCCQMNLKIYKLCEGSYNLYYRSVIKGNLGKWDLSQCWFKTELQPVDKYECILENIDVQKNILELTQVEVDYTPDDIAGSPSLYYHTPWHEYTIQPIAPVAPGTTFDIGDGGALFRECNVFAGEAVDPVTGNAWCVFVREKKVIIYDGDFNFTPPASFFTIGGFWSLLDTIYQLGNKVVAIYTRMFVSATNIPYVDSYVNGNGGLIAPTGLFTQLYDPINDNNIFIYFNAVPPDVTSTYNSVRLDDTIFHLLSNCNVIGSVTSDFFEINPIGDTPGYVSGMNYVTNKFQFINNIMIIPMGNILFPNGDPVTIQLMTFNELMKYLRGMFNVYWHIDANYRLRIEHYSWYSAAQIEDLTIGESVFYNEKKKAFSFNKEETPIQEVFKMEFANNSDFIGAPIVYSNNCSNNKVKTIDIGQVSTDMEFIRTNDSGRFNSAGVVLITCLKEASPYDTTVPLYEQALISGLYYQNAHLSWANLLYNYHRHGRPLINGNMNFEDETFFSAIKRRKQQNQKSLNCCLDVPETIGYIKTELGEGDATLITENLESNIIDLELNV